MAKTDTEIKFSIEHAIKAFSSGSLTENSLNLFQVLGYNTERQQPLDDKTFACFKEYYLQVEKGFNEIKAKVNDWKQIDLLFQLSVDEMRSQRILFDTCQVDQTIMESYLFFAIELKEQEYSRTALSQITREINKVFDMPVMLLFKLGEKISLAVINRRLHEKYDKDVLGKVTLIKDINIRKPIRAHIEILFEISLPTLKCSNFVELHKAWAETLDTKELNKRFYRDLSNWYFWAKDHVNFPPGQERSPSDVVQATCVIRLITRLIFVWFLKEKRVEGHRIIPTELFEKESLSELLVGFDLNGGAEKKIHSTYYRAILQNLFFATLNQPMKNRRWRKEGKDDDKNVYRYQNLFKSPEKVHALFKDIPFLNGGLFECLEQDQFSDLPDIALRVPDFLFFSKDIEYDLNTVYGTRNKKYSVNGIIDILSHYNFTVEENTPLEEEIALDPELLGNVFENLLASYNPETGATARKQSGSFYTPREIVNYMVDESLKEYLLQKLAGSDTKGNDERFNKLFSYKEVDNPFEQGETELLIDAIYHLKVLDPACGSGAFPMGMLHKMTHILAILDPGNERWKERQLRAITDPGLREYIEQTFDFNEKDFGRKLYLIQNCIYGVDIQPIAVQIAKLRFFISLIVDQRIHPDQDNLGILPLPNMETKFVAANTLIGLEEPKQLVFQEPAIEIKVNELDSVRRKYFTANNQIAKQKCILDDEKLRKEIGELLKRGQWNPTTADKIAAWNPYDTTKSSDFFNPKWMFGVADGFDICIGNPPYLRVQGLQQTQPEFISYYREKYKSAQGSFDIYALFVEQGYSLLTARGQLVYILPHKFFQASFGVGLRRLLTSRKAVRQVVRFGSEQVFEEATTYTCLLFLSATQQKQFDLLEVKSLTSGSEVLDAASNRLSHVDYSIEVLPAPEDTNWDFNIGESNIVLARLQQHPRKLGKIVRKIFQGIATSADKLYVLRIVEDKGAIIRCFSKYLEEEIEIERGLVKPFLMGKDVHRYEPPKPANVVIFPYHSVDGRMVLMDQPEIKKRFPLGWKYLKRNEDALGEREGGRMHGENFYAYIYPKNLAEFEFTKIMTPEIALGCQMSLDKEGVYYHTTKVYSFIFKPEVKGSTKYFLGLLNSKVLWFFLTQTGYVLRGGYYTFKTDYLKPFPIPDSSITQQKVIETFVDYLLYLKALPAAKIVNSSRHPLIISFFEQLIDGVVYELYFPESFKDAEVNLSELLIKENLQSIEQCNDDVVTSICNLFERIYIPEHPVRKSLFFLDTIEAVRVVEEHAK